MKSASSVWIVQHDERPDNTILGVFAMRNEASTFAEEVKAQFENGVIFAPFALGNRFDDNSARYSSGDETSPSTVPARERWAGGL